MSETHGDQFDKLLAAYKISKSGFEEGKKLVEYLALNKQSQHSEIVLEFGIHVAQTMPHILKDLNLISLSEEFFLAALDIKQIDWAMVFLRAICIQFPNNIKSMRFLAMYYEAM